jgi:MYXO-CTERM domain-containing protein
MQCARYILFLALFPFPAWPARLFTSGFETNDVMETEWTQFKGGFVTVVPQNSLVRSGRFAGRGNYVATAASIGRDLDGIATSGTYFTRFYFYAETLPSVVVFILSAANTSDVSSLIVSYDPALGVLRLENAVTGTTVFGTTVIATGKWYRLETRLLVADSGGEADLRLYDGDNTTTLDALSIVGEDTLPAGISTFFLGSEGGAGTWAFDVDDVAINDDTGTFQNSWPGPGRVVLVGPASDVATGWTASVAGPNFHNVDDEPGTPDDDATYNHTIGSTAQDSFQLTPVSSQAPPNQAPVLAQVFARAGSDSSGINSSILLQWWDAQGTMFEGLPFDTTVNGYRIGKPSELLVVNLSASTLQDVDLSRIGYVAAPDPTALKKVTALWANVELHDAPATLPDGGTPPTGACLGTVCVGHLYQVGCGCSAGGESPPLLFMWAVVLALHRRRRTPGSQPRALA